MHSAVLRICATFAIFPFVVILHPLHNPAQSSTQNDNPTENRVWLAVEEHSRAQLLIEPIATVEDSVLTSVQTSCLSDTATPEGFSSKYLQSGREYARLFGGASVGVGQVGQQNPRAAAASLTYTGLLKIHGQVRALATNREPRDFRAASREPATAEQRGAALALAREIFSQHGIPEALLPDVRAEYVTRTYLAPSPQPTPIASFSFATGDSEGLLHSIFFVASQPGEKLQHRSFSGFIFPRARPTRSICVLWITPTFSEMDRMKSLLACLSRNPDSSVRGFSQNERRRPPGTNFQNRAVGLFVVSAQEK